MCFGCLWKRRRPPPLTLRTPITIHSPMIVISPLAQPKITPILPKKCSFCNGIMFNKRQSYHKECFYTAMFKRNQEREQKKSNISNSF
tara:strand:+ start:504 stop:767 length:264 start_codon:yes stop_codon:yes gene_type:complete